MKIETKKIKLDSLIQIRTDIETFIKIKQIELGKCFLSKDYDSIKVEGLVSLIKAAEEQLIEIKIVIQKANTNEIHEDGKINYYYVYKLSSKNRELANLKQILRRKENLEVIVDKVKSRKDNPSKKTLTEIQKKIENRISELEIEISDIKQKLTDFNKRVEVEVQVHEGFEKMIN